MKQVILSAAMLLTYALGHSTIYHVNQDLVCNVSTPAPILSYHIHLLYFQRNKEHTDGAYRIRAAMKDAFKDILGDDCHDLTHNNQTCMLDADLEPAGPFPTAEWSFFVLPDHIGEMTAWIMQHKEKYSILIHTNSGCEVQDHSEWTLWGNEPWPLDVGFFTKDSWKQMKSSNPKSNFLLQ